MKETIDLIEQAQFHLDKKSKEWLKLEVVKLTTIASEEMAKHINAGDFESLKVISIQLEMKIRSIKWDHFLSNLPKGGIVRD
jgi:hypothetical protein